MLIKTIIERDTENGLWRVEVFAKGQHFMSRIAHNEMELAQIKETAQIVETQIANLTDVELQAVIATQQH